MVDAEAGRPHATGDGHPIARIPGVGLIVVGAETPEVHPSSNGPTPNGGWPPHRGPRHPDNHRTQVLRLVAKPGVERTPVPLHPSLTPSVPDEALCSHILSLAVAEDEMPISARRQEASDASSCRESDGGIRGHDHAGGA